MNQPSSGRAQDPLNYLQRQIALSQRFDKTTKRHVMLEIREAKRHAMDHEQAVSEALRLWSYSQMLRLQALLDTLKESDKGYKSALWARTKLSEDYRRYMSRAKIKGSRTRTNTAAVSTAPWGKPKSTPVPQDTPAEDAEET